MIFQIRYLPYTLLILVTVFLTACKTDTGDTTSEQSILFCGTYTQKEGHVDGKADGIHRLRRDDNTGALTWVGTIPDIINPSYIDVQGDYLYAASETGPGIDTTAYLYAYQIVGDSLVYTGRKPSYGYAACHVATDDRYVVVSNYVGGTIAAYHRGADGHLGELALVDTFTHHVDPPRQESSHPHSAMFAPDKATLYVADLGGDRVYQYAVSDTSIQPLASPYKITQQGAGPRHMVFHPDSSQAYILNELNNSIVIAAYDPSSGNLNRRSAMTTLPIGYNQPSLAADIDITPDGRFLYASNRGHGSIAIYATESLKMTFVDFQPLGGKTPRNILVSEDGRFLHVSLQDIGKIETYKIGPDGRLELVDELAIPTPVCLVEAG